jgi:hypothetical protein
LSFALQPAAGTCDSWSQLTRALAHAPLSGNFLHISYGSIYSMSSGSSSCLLPCLGVRHLLHDLREVLDHPLPDVSCLPLDDDLYTWHGNGECWGISSAI